MSLTKPIPKEIRDEMDSMPFYHRCARRDALHDHECQRDPLKPLQPVEWEHAIYFKGERLNEMWAIIPLCWLVHRGGKLNKEINEWIALNRASEAELMAISKAENYILKKARLNVKYGIYKPNL